MLLFGKIAPDILSLDELTNHLDLLSMVILENIINNLRSTYDSIDYEDLEFIVVDKGRMTYNVNGKLIELSASDGIMVNSRQLHYGFSAEHHECEFLCILLSPSLLPKNEWFYENCIERITAHSALPYLYLKHDG